MNPLKKYYASFIIRRNLKLKILKYPYVNFPRFFLLNVPSHGNLGDHLIAFAEIQFLKKFFNNQLIVLTTGEHQYGFDIMKKYIQEKDIIFISGGGFLGSQWIEEENRVSEIISQFLKNKIFILPQSIFYEESSNGRELMNKMSFLYSNHPNLKIYLREKESYNIATFKMKIPQDKIALYPDMAFYLKDFFPIIENKNGILFCLRKDKESVISHSKINFKELINYKISFLDTQVPRSVSLKNQQEEIFNLMVNFRKAKLVVTDRMHGLIFAILSQTPVIALGSLTHKIKRTCSTWLSNFPSVVFLENINDLLPAISHLYNIDPETVSIPDFDLEFLDLAKDIDSLCYSR